MFKAYYPTIVLKRRVLIQFRDIKTGKAVDNSYLYLKKRIDEAMEDSPDQQVDAIKWCTIFNIGSTHSKAEVYCEDKYYHNGRLLNRVPSEVISFGKDCVSIDGNPYTICRTETEKFYEGDTRFKKSKYGILQRIWDFILGY